MQNKGKIYMHEKKNYIYIYDQEKITHKPQKTGKKSNEIYIVKPLKKEQRLIGGAGVLVKRTLFFPKALAER